MEALAVRDEPQTLLSECLIFRAVDEDGRRMLAARTRRNTYRAGTTIFRVGDPGRNMMVIADGTVRVTLPGKGGGNVTLAELGRGSVLGEVALLDGRPRTANAEAATDCTVYLLERPALGGLLRSNPRISMALVELLCERLRRADERLADIGEAVAPG